MPYLDFNGWLKGGDSLVMAQKPIRAMIQEARIGDKPIAITLKRGNTTLAAQTVRLEVDDRASEATSAVGEGAVRKATLFGVRDHPTLSNFNVQNGDRFVRDKIEYTVVSVNRELHGQIQAYCEAVS